MQKIWYFSHFCIFENICNLAKSMLKNEVIPSFDMTVWDLILLYQPFKVFSIFQDWDWSKPCCSIGGKYILNWEKLSLIFSLWCGDFTGEVSGSGFIKLSARFFRTKFFSFGRSSVNFQWIGRKGRVKLFRCHCKKEIKHVFICHPIAIHTTKYTIIFYVVIGNSFFCHNVLFSK